jgi:putative endonuclease
MAWCVYVLECGDGSLYTGITNDLVRRLAEHQAGRGSHYTRAHLPVRLVAAWSFGDRPSALSAEARFKQLRRAQKLLMIRNRVDFHRSSFAADLMVEVMA